MKAVIMAGGRGTRISSLANDIPKPMIPIAGKPVLEHLIMCLKIQGFTEIIITVSHLFEKIISYFGDGSSFGVQIEYYIEEQPLGNAGALFKLRKKLNECFLLINADVLFNVDMNRFVAYHKAKSGYATLFTHPNNHPYDSAILVADENNAVVKWITKEDEHPMWYRNRVNAGLHIIDPKILDLSRIDPELVGQSKDGKIVKVDLDRDLLKPLSGTGKLFCYDSPEYVKDMGTPERYQSVCTDYQMGKIEAKSLRKKQKAIFLDRDGTINKYVGFLRSIDEFELLPGVSEAIKQINDSDYLAIVVTNQPVIARGEVSYGQLRETHNKMETKLGEAGAYIDALYFCPHHPDKGFEGEIAELKVDCNCRKPKPGMLLKAAEDYHIDLSASWMVGDQKSDILAGQAAGCKTVLIGDGSFGQNLSKHSLLEFTNYLLNK